MNSSIKKSQELWDQRMSLTDEIYVIKAAVGEGALSFADPELALHYQTLLNKKKEVEEKLVRHGTIDWTPKGSAKGHGYSEAKIFRLSEREIPDPTS